MPAYTMCLTGGTVDTDSLSATSFASNVSPTLPPPFGPKPERNVHVSIIFIFKLVHPLNNSSRQMSRAVIYSYLQVPLF